MAASNWSTDVRSAARWGATNSTCGAHASADVAQPAVQDGDTVVIGGTADLVELAVQRGDRGFEVIGVRQPVRVQFGHLGTESDEGDAKLFGPRVVRQF